MRSKARAPFLIAAAALALSAWFVTSRLHASANVARGCRVTASSSYQTSVPANAVDGDRKTQWNAVHHPPAWIELDQEAVHGSRCP